MSEKKVNILSELSALATKIRHQEGLASKGAPNSELVAALTKNIHAYIDMAITGIRGGAIAADPLAIVNGKGFKEGTVAHKISDTYLKSLLENDQDGLIVALYAANTETRNEMPIKLKNGVTIFVGRVLTVMKGAVLKSIDVLKNSALAVWNFIREVFVAVVGAARSAGNWIASLFRAKPASATSEPGSVDVDIDSGDNVTNTKLRMAV